MEALGITGRRKTQVALAAHLFDVSIGVRISALCAMSCVPTSFPESLVRALTAKLDDPDRLVVAELARQSLTRR